jgi:hypothetical protein
LVAISPVILLHGVGLQGTFRFIAANYKIMQ